MALGAALGDIRIMVLREGLALIAFGLAIAAPLSFAGARLLSGLLFGVHSGDAYTIVLAVTFVALVGILASYLPASRATRVAPIQALRSE
jgi:ABC-type antimicrobial peptide transport system permease subunit